MDNIAYRLIQGLFWLLCTFMVFFLALVGILDLFGAGIMEWSKLETADLAFFVGYFIWTNQLIKDKVV